MDSDLAWVNGKSGRQSWRAYADTFQRSIILEAICHFLLVPRPTCPRRKSVDGNNRWRGLLARYIEHCMCDTQWHQYQCHCVDQYPDVLLCGSNEAPACLISSFISSFIIPLLRLSSRCSHRLLVLQLLLCITAAVGMGLLHGELWTDWRLMHSQLTYQLMRISYDNVMPPSAIYYVFLLTISQSCNRLNAAAVNILHLSKSCLLMNNIDLSVQTEVVLMCLNVFLNDFLLLCFYICIPFICACFSARLFSVHVCMCWCTCLFLQP